MEIFTDDDNNVWDNWMDVAVEEARQAELRQMLSDLKRLPKNIWLKILTENPHLTVREIAYMCSIDRDFYRLCHGQEGRSIWDLIFIQRYGPEQWRQSQSELSLPSETQQLSPSVISLLRLQTWRSFFKSPYDKRRYDERYYFHFERPLGIHKTQVHVETIPNNDTWTSIMFHSSADKDDDRGVRQEFRDGISLIFKDARIFESGKRLTLNVVSTNREVRDRDIRLFLYWLLLHKYRNEEYVLFRGDYFPRRVTDIGTMQDELCTDSDESGDDDEGESSEEHWEVEDLYELGAEWTPWGPLGIAHGIPNEKGPVNMHSLYQLLHQAYEEVLRDPYHSEHMVQRGESLLNQLEMHLEHPFGDRHLVANCSDYVARVDMGPDLDEAIYGELPVDQKHVGDAEVIHLLEREQWKLEQDLADVFPEEMEEDPDFDELITPPTPEIAGQVFALRARHAEVTHLLHRTDATDALSEDHIDAAFDLIGKPRKRRLRKKRRNPQKRAARKRARAQRRALRRQKQKGKRRLRRERRQMRKDTRSARRAQRKKQGALRRAERKKKAQARRAARKETRTARRAKRKERRAGTKQDRKARREQRRARRKERREQRKQVRKEKRGARKAGREQRRVARKQDRKERRAARRGGGVTVAPATVTPSRTFEPPAGPGPAGGSGGGGGYVPPSEPAYQPEPQYEPDYQEVPPAPEERVYRQEPTPAIPREKYYRKAERRQERGIRRQERRDERGLRRQERRQDRTYVYRRGEEETQGMREERKQVIKEDRKARREMRREQRGQMKEMRRQEGESLEAFKERQQQAEKLYTQRQALKEERDAILERRDTGKVLDGDDERLTQLDEEIRRKKKQQEALQSGAPGAALEEEPLPEDFDVDDERPLPPIPEGYEDYGASPWGYN